MQDPLTITGPLYSSLKAECEAAGTNLTVVCKGAKVSRSTVEKWKQGDPKTIKQLRAIRTEIAKQSKLKDQSERC
jgi:hypothetical protein